MSRVLPHLLAVTLVIACIAGSTIAWSNFASSAGAPAYVTKADFDQAFADVAAGQHPTTNVNREGNRDRSPVFRDALFRERIGAYLNMHGARL